jgi:hypothetical protein
MIRVPIKRSPKTELFDESSDVSLAAKVERALVKSEIFVTTYDPSIADVKFEEENTGKLPAMLKKLGRLPVVLGLNSMLSVAI